MTRVIPFPASPVTRDARDLLILDHLHLVKIAARSIKRRLPPSFELDDLIGEGTLGLITAADTYDASRGPFKGRAQFMINTAILESVRRRNWTANTMGELTRQNGLMGPCDEESGHQRSIEPLREDPDLSEETLNADIDERANQKILSFAIAALRPRYRAIMNSYYRRGRSITGAAKRLGIEPSRASQLHHEALRALTMALSARGVSIEYAALRAAVVSRPARAKNAA